MTHDISLSLIQTKKSRQEGLECISETNIPCNQFRCREDDSRVACPLLTDSCLENIMMQLGVIDSRTSRERTTITVTSFSRIGRSFVKTSGSEAGARRFGGSTPYCFDALGGALSPSRRSLSFCRFFRDKRSTEGHFR